MKCLGFRLLYNNMPDANEMRTVSAIIYPIGELLAAASLIRYIQHFLCGNEARSFLPFALANEIPASDTAVESRTRLYSHTRMLTATDQCKDINEAIALLPLLHMWSHFIGLI